MTAMGATVPLRSRPGIALIATAVCASAVASVDASVINVAVPAIGKAFHASVAAVQWTVTGYLVAVAALLLPAGALADRFGRRRLLAIGLVVMTIASVLCAVAPTIGALIAGRIVLGMGGALVVPNSLALLNGTLRKSDRARGIGLWAGLETLGIAIGPYAGGWLVDHVSWRAVFLLGIPLIAVALVANTRVPETGEERREGSVDRLGGALAIIGLGGVIYGLISGPASGWANIRCLLPLGVGIAALLALFPVERRVSAPTIRVSLFASKQFDAINIATFLFYGALGAASYLVVLQLELRLGYSATDAGAALIPETAVFLVLAPFSGALVAWAGPRWPMVLGIGLVGAALFWMSAVHSGSSYVGAILPALLLWGLGLGVTVTPLTAAVLAAAEDRDLGEASAVNDAASRVGGAVLVALVPALIGATGGSSLAHGLAQGYQPAMIVMAVICVIAAAISFWFVVGRSVVRPAGLRDTTSLASSTNE